jgi:hypothetical protein
MKKARNRMKKLLRRKLALKSSKKSKNLQREKNPSQQKI